MFNIKRTLRKRKHFKLHMYTYTYINSKRYIAFRPKLTIAKPKKTSKHAITPPAEHMNSKILNITEAAQRKKKNEDGIDCRFVCSLYYLECEAHEILNIYTYNMIPFPFPKNFRLLAYQLLQLKILFPYTNSHFPLCIFHQNITEMVNKIFVSSQLLDCI